jgi:hypothetical protein
MTVVYKEERRHEWLVTIARNEEIAQTKSKRRKGKTGDGELQNNEGSKGQAAHTSHNTINSIGYCLHPSHTTITLFDVLQ